MCNEKDTEIESMERRNWKRYRGEHTYYKQGRTGEEKPVEKETGEILQDKAGGKEEEEKKTG